MAVRFVFTDALLRQEAEFLDQKQQQTGREREGQCNRRPFHESRPSGSAFPVNISHTHAGSASRALVETLVLDDLAYI
jgi:hypothetical protein